MVVRALTSARLGSSPPVNHDQSTAMLSRPWSYSRGHSWTTRSRRRPQRVVERPQWRVVRSPISVSTVISTRVGYTGGDVPNATYRNHEGHAEAIEIVFDPERISFRDILEFFFQIHDPTTKDRQGNDLGSSYRSEIFYTSDEQREVAEETIADVDASGLWQGKVVTEVSEAGPFWEAEPEHQDYLQKNPGGYTCHFVRPDWKLPRREGAAT